jgi:hypothetical protein
MSHFGKRLVLGLVLILGTVFSGEVSAQASKDKLAGTTWTLVAITYNQDGKTRDIFGASPAGTLMFDMGGRFAQVIMRSDFPKFASNNRETGTPEENKAIVQGSIAYFGTYSVSNETISLHVDGSTFPNWKGTDQKRTLTLSEDELKWTNPTPSAATGGGTTATLVWKRIK